MLSERRARWIRVGAWCVATALIVLLVHAVDPGRAARVIAQQTTEASTTVVAQILRQASASRGMVDFAVDATAFDLAKVQDRLGFLEGSFAVEAGQVMGGSGQITMDVYNDGRISPGYSPGRIDISGDYNQTGTLTIGTRTGSPPFAYVNKDNQWVGFSIDLVEQLVRPSVEKAVGRAVKVEKKESTPPTRIPLLSSNAVDLIVHLGWVEGERRVTSVREVTGAVEAGQVVSNELWRPDEGGFAVPAAPPTPEFASALEREGFEPSSHAAADGWWR